MIRGIAAILLLLGLLALLPGGGGGSISNNAAALDTAGTLVDPPSRRALPAETPADPPDVSFAQSITWRAAARQSARHRPRARRCQPGRSRRGAFRPRAPPTGTVRI